MGSFCRGGHTARETCRVNKSGNAGRAPIIHRGHPAGISSQTPKCQSRQSRHPIPAPETRSPVQKSYGQKSDFKRNAPSFVGPSGDPKSPETLPEGPWGTWRHQGTWRSQGSLQQPPAPSRALPTSIPPVWMMCCIIFPPFGCALRCVCAALQCVTLHCLALRACHAFWCTFVLACSIFRNGRTDTTMGHLCVRTHVRPAKGAPGGHD